MKLQEVVKQYSSNESFVEAVDKEITNLIESKPDFKYNTIDRHVGCAYNGPATIGVLREPAGPLCKGCIFGQALQNLGWSDEVELFSGSPISQLFSDNDVRDFEPPDYWQSIQNRQDAGDTWGSLRRF